MEVRLQSKLPPPLTSQLGLRLSPLPDPSPEEKILITPMAPFMWAWPAGQLPTFSSTCILCFGLIELRQEIGFGAQGFVWDLGFMGSWSDCARGVRVLLQKPALVLDCPDETVG